MPGGPDIQRSRDYDTLSLGLLATAPLDFTPRLLRAFAQIRPTVAVSIRNIAFDDPTGGVRSRLTDAALVWRPFDETGLVCQPLFTEERVAVLPVDHPLARKKTIDARELALEPWVWVDDMDETARSFWTLSAERDGRPPRVGASITGSRISLPPFAPVARSPSVRSRLRRRCHGRIWSRGRFAVSHRPASRLLPRRRSQSDRPRLCRVCARPCAGKLTMPSSDDRLACQVVN